jgi:hypothetical protein
MHTKLNQLWQKRTQLFAITWTFVGGFCLLVVFQNCAGMGDIGHNPLYSSFAGSYCLGVNCGKDLTQAIITTSVNEILIDNGTDSTGCNAANCFDVGGFCETGGYSSSVFIHQWTLAGGTAQFEVRTAAICDDNGRFNFQVHIPPGLDRSKSHSLRVYMKVIDEGRNEFTNPTGANARNYAVRSRL